MTDEITAATTNLPGQFPVTVIMERRPAQVSSWVDYVWTVIGVTVGDVQQLPGKSSVSHIEKNVQLHIHSGYRVKLYVDECDSYYRNLLSSSPHCFVVVHQDDDQPEPFIVTLSYNEAHAYLEGDDTVFAVAIPPELYCWTEAFVLTHYCPRQLKKRKRKNWSQQQAECSIT